MNPIATMVGELFVLALLFAMLGLGLALATPSSVVSGLLGVGSGFMHLPALITLCFDPKHAAITAVAVIPPSFSALIPHPSTAEFDPNLTWMLLVVGAIGSFPGVRITSLWVPGMQLKQAFGVLIVAITAYKTFTLAG